MVRRGRFVVTASLLAATLALSAAAVDDPATHRRRNRPVNEWQIKDPINPDIPPVRAGLDTASYDGTNTGGPTWDRPIGCGPSISGLGPVHYHVELITVDTSGAYDIASVQDHDGYLHLYAEAFDPSPPHQVTNCLAGNDDSPDGIGTSALLGVPLAAGSAYFLVTSGFSADQHGSFTNTVSGPGIVTIGDRGPDLAVAVTANATSAAPGDSFLYAIELINEGPGEAATVEVAATLSSNLTLDGSSCGPLPWTIRQLGEGSSVTCTVAVTLHDCGPASLTAEAVGADADDPADNRATATINPSAVADPGFEAGTPSTASQEASTHFRTPLCTEEICGTGTGTGPASGQWWAWFGGIPSREEGSLSQSVTILAGDQAFLQFELETFVCSGSATDFFEITIDGNREFYIDATDVHCGVRGYRSHTLNLTAYADGEAHTLRLHALTDSGQTTNFFVDDLSLFACRGVIAPEAPGIPTLDTLGLALLAFALAGGALLSLRRRRAG